MKDNRMYAEKRRYTEKWDKDIYSHDNLARKYSAEEEKRQRNLEKIRVKAEENARNSAQANAGINSGIDFASVVVLSLAIVCMVAIGLQYLVLSSQITEMNNEVSALNSSYNSIKSMNDEIYNSIDNSVDIGHVYEVAVGELGMVFPSDNQVVNYDYSEDGYVRQYTSVPE